MVIDIKGKKKVITPPEIVNGLLAAVGEDMVLVAAKRRHFGLAI